MRLTQEGREGLSSFMRYPDCLAHLLVHSKCSINICCVQLPPRCTPSWPGSCPGKNWVTATKIYSSVSALAAVVLKGPLFVVAWSPPLGKCPSSGLKIIPETEGTPTLSEPGPWEGKQPEISRHQPFPLWAVTFPLILKDGNVSKLCHAYHPPSKMAWFSKNECGARVRTGLPSYLSWLTGFTV